MEYAGYIAPEKTTDWAALTGQLAGKLDTIGKDRAAKKEELDAKAKDAEAYINSIDMTQNQTANQILTDGAYNGKSKILQWNKDLKAGILSPKDYNNKLATLNEYFGTLSNSLKTFDQRYQEVLRRQESGEASAYEVELANRFGQLANLQNAQLQVSDQGRVYMTKVDPKTGKIVEDLIDVRTINSPENIVANKVDVAGQTSKLMEGWDPKTIWKDLGRGGEMTIESIRNNDAYKLMRANLAETVASDENPRAQLSVLVDNGVINADYYINEAERKQKISDAIERAKKIKQTAGQPAELSDKELKDIEMSMVKLEKDASGIINPVLSDEQKAAAKERVMQEVDIRAGEKVTGSAKQDWYHAPTKSNDDDGSGESDEVQKMLAGYTATLDAFGIDRDSILTGSTTYTNNHDFSRLSNNYEYKWEQGGVGVYKPGTKTRIALVKSPSGLAQYAYGASNPADATLKYNKARNIYKSKSPSNKNNNDLPTGTRAEFKAAGWTDEDINRGIKEGSIKVK